VEVYAARSHKTFEPGVGHPATVKIRDGLPTCVMGGWFRF
jgi:hypothetical protein